MMGKRELRAAMVLLMMSTMAWASDPESREIPELAGAERITGPIAVDGELPAPYIDYVIEVGRDQSQKLTLFQNGLVILSTRIGSHTTMKRVLFPPSAVDAYREHLSTDRLSQIDLQPLIATPTKMRETIRIHDADGDQVERKYDPSLYLPSELEAMRLLLQDLARVLTEDNEVTNPMADYVPQAKDRLVDQQMQGWTVLRIVNDHVELQSESNPLRAWVKADQLDEQFVSWSRPAPLSSE